MYQTLSIDIETYSSRDLTRSGVYPYTEAADFQILLFGYAFDDEPPQVVDLSSGEELPSKVFAAFTDENILKTAFNAAFEIACIEAHFGIRLDASQWECTMIRAAMLGLPLSLAQVAQVLGLPVQKMEEGKSLIRHFSMPAAEKGKQRRNHPVDDPQRWALFKEYNATDVEVETDIRRRLAFFSIPEKEHRLWQLDQQINRTGVALDLPFVRAALSVDRINSEHLLREARSITGLDNPNSTAQLSRWIAQRTGQEVTSLRKADLATIGEGCTDTPLSRVLAIRGELGKTSLRKYDAMEDTVCADGRVRGLIQFYGAGRTGRFAGRLVQMQNLPQNHLPDLALARSLVQEQDVELLRLTFGNVSEVLSQLIRTAFVAPEASRLLVADFNAIEARLLSWWAGERWRMEVFATHGKIYEASAAAMFGVPLEQVTKGSDLRQKGKVAEIACGYQGGVGALEAMGAVRGGVAREQLPSLVKAWRDANPAIVGLWYDVERAACDTVENDRLNTVNGVRFFLAKDILFVRLPSGRHLAYPRPRLVERRTAAGIRKTLSYEGLSDKKKWEQIDTYGGKLVENITQAIARDCLCESLLRLDQAGYRIIFHVHDEVVIESPEGMGSVEEVCSIMEQPIDWAEGLLLRAEGYETPFYKKD